MSSLSAQFTRLDPSKGVNDYFEVNEDLLEMLRRVQGGSEPDDAAMHVLTASSPELLEAFREQLQPPFRELITASEHGLSKSDPESYRTLAEQFGVDPSKILFVDDSKSRLDAAEAAGVSTFHYQDWSGDTTRLKDILQKAV